MASDIKNVYVELDGIIEWAKLFEHNRDQKGYNDAYVDTNGRTTVNFILDDDNMAKLKKTGSLKRGKPDPEGRGTSVKFDRKWETGREWDSGAPAVYRVDGNPWNHEVDGEIGNGSIGRIQLVVTYFPSVKTFSTRIEKVKILEHVPYEGPTDPFKVDESGKAPAPQKAATPTTTPPPMEEDLSDEIPF
jgi:hypothetical protein